MPPAPGRCVVDFAAVGPVGCVACLLVSASIGLVGLPSYDPRDAHQLVDAAG